MQSSLSSNLCCSHLGMTFCLPLFTDTLKKMNKPKEGKICLCKQVHFLQIGAQSGARESLCTCEERQSGTVTLLLCPRKRTRSLQTPLLTPCLTCHSQLDEDTLGGLNTPQVSACSTLDKRRHLTEPASPRVDAAV